MSFKIYNEGANAIFDASSTVEVIHENDQYPFAHEAGVFVPEENALFITSNQFPDPTTGQKTIQISKVQLSPDGKFISCEEVNAPDVIMANGGVNYNGGVLFCSQGSLTVPGGLVFMQPIAPYRSAALVTSFYGRDFNSLNDVVVHSDGSLWFTDPIYGYEQGIRPAPQLRNQVYRYDSKDESVRVVADGFGRPNGISFSPDEKVVYITDTDWIHGDGTTDDTRARTIYAFDLSTISGEPFLTNKRVFAMADTGIPDGIKCDTKGNVYSGCGDGVNVWSPGGVLLGKILISGGVANFCFGRNGELFMLNEHKIWRAQLASGVKGALLGI
ncbi:gluconolactonase [Fusarium pseudocircinatum]|uniref:Gluconolactonase n=1 Tax=Fusarium pseudocircinatum TaxID=56676 RepID=A0A8H5PWG0_9HYPO|nr:gluconolactonase [Fusarium pseudocircinatum]